MNQPFIVTRYFGPTDSRGSRIKATSVGSGTSIYVPWDAALDQTANHEAAARALLDRKIYKHTVTGKLLRCETKDTRGFVFTEAAK